MVGDILQPTHLLLVLVVALLVLGPKRLPEVARHLGSGIRDFKDAISGEHSEPPAEPSRMVRSDVTPPEAMQTHAVAAEPFPAQASYTDAAQEPETKQTDAVVSEPEQASESTSSEPSGEPDAKPLAAPEHPPAPASDAADAATTQFSSQHPT